MPSSTQVGPVSALRREGMPRSTIVKSNGDLDDDKGQKDEVTGIGQGTVL